MVKPCRSRKVSSVHRVTVIESDRVATELMVTGRECSVNGVSRRPMVKRSCSTSRHSIYPTVRIVPIIIWKSVTGTGSGRLSWVGVENANKFICPIHNIKLYIPTITAHIHLLRPENNICFSYHIKVRRLENYTRTFCIYYFIYRKVLRQCSSAEHPDILG